jgi:hypothetical protein
VDVEIQELAADLVRHNIPEPSDNEVSSSRIADTSSWMVLICPRSTSSASLNSSASSPQSGITRISSLPRPTITPKRHPHKPSMPTTQLSPQSAGDDHRPSQPNSSRTPVSSAGLTAR